MTLRNLCNSERRREPLHLHLEQENQYAVASSPKPNIPNHIISAQTLLMPLCEAMWLNWHKQHESSNGKAKFVFLFMYLDCFWIMDWTKARLNSLKARLVAVQEPKISSSVKSISGPVTAAMTRTWKQESERFWESLHIFWSSGQNSVNYMSTS